MAVQVTQESVLCSQDLCTQQVKGERGMGGKGTVHAEHGGHEGPGGRGGEESEGRLGARGMGAEPDAKLNGGMSLMMWEDTWDA